MASKGIIEFLNASKQLLKDDRSIRIDIAGDFISDNYLPLKNEIKKKFLDLFEGLKNDFPERIFYYGPVSGIKKVDLLRSSSIFKYYQATIQQKLFRYQLLRQWLQEMQLFQPSIII